ncbi:hypothetical protein TELCIR_12659, partial [Teladorsagia circumcincta]
AAATIYDNRHKGRLRFRKATTGATHHRKDRSSAFTALLSPHVFSIYRHRHVFLCRSGVPSNATIEEKYMAYDIIIFDFGLMHRVLGTEECVANYLVVCELDDKGVRHSVNPKGCHER